MDSMHCQVLLITNKHDLTTDYVVAALKDRGIPFYRFNTEDLFKTIDFKFIATHGNIEAYLIDETLNQQIDLKGIKSVYYRRPGVPHHDGDFLTGPEKRFLTSEHLRVLEGIYKLLDKAYWISPVWRIREAENKIWQLKTAWECGLTIPDSLLTHNPTELESFRLTHKSVIIKPISSGLVEESQDKSRVIFTSNVLDSISSEDVEQTFAYLQKEEKKLADVRVTVVDKSVFATLIHSQEEEEGKTDWRRANKILRHECIKLPDEINSKCIEMMVKMGLKYGAFDFILTNDNKFVFLELNPNGQWAWIENQTGYKIADTIAVSLIRQLYGSN